MKTFVRLLAFLVLFVNSLSTHRVLAETIEYVAPEGIEDYAGLYVGQAPIAELNTTWKVIVNIREDGMFNLAFYYDNEPFNTGIRFYVNESNEIQTTEADYLLLTLLTGNLYQDEEGVESALIEGEIYPVVLLNSQGESEALYTYQKLVQRLGGKGATTYLSNSGGLRIIADTVRVDGNYLIGFETKEALDIPLVFLEEDDDQFLVESTVSELLRYNFVNYLVDYQEFDRSYDSANDFVQKVLATYLKLNWQFPPGSEVELITPEDVLLDASLEADSVIYALLVNDQALYVYDGTYLYRTRYYELLENQYQVKSWRKI